MILNKIFNWSTRAPVKTRLNAWRLGDIKFLNNIATRTEQRTIEQQPQCSRTSALSLSPRSSSRKLSTPPSPSSPSASPADTSNASDCPQLTMRTVTPVLCRQAPARSIRNGVHGGTKAAAARWHIAEMVKVRLNSQLQETA